MKNVTNRKRMIIVCCVVAVLLLGAVVALRAYRSYTAAWHAQQRNQKGILLAFDDYSPNSWSEHFDLFDKYGVKVTFFVNLSEPDDFCEEAVKRGHEIGFHTATHASLTDVSEEEFYAEAIAPIENFREKVEELLDVLAGCNDGTVACVYSHAISGGDWCITADRLEILFQEAEERELAFYTFQELQQ